MRSLLQWFTSPEWTQVVKALLHSLWQGALIAVILAIFLRRFSNPVVRYRSAFVALAAIVFATVITWAIINAPTHRPAPSTDVPALASPASDPVAISEPHSTAETVVIMRHKTSDARWTAWLAFAWLAGALLMLARAGFKVAGAEQLRRSCRPLNDARIEALLTETRRALGIANQIRVGVTDKLTSPAVVGVVVPILILPLTLLTTLTLEQIRFILLHELAHIRRRDYLANLFQFLAESLLFFNPAVWWISHQIRREREACCDALATELSGAPAEYAKTLMHVAEQVLYPAPTAAPAFGNKREPSTLAERIHRLLIPGYRPSLRLTWRAMLAALVFGSILLFLSAVGTRMTVAAILTPQERIAEIKKKAQEYGALPKGDLSIGRRIDEKTSVTAHLRTSDGSPLPKRVFATLYSESGTPQNRSGAFSTAVVKKDGTINGISPSGQIWLEADAEGFASAIAGPFDADETNRLDAGELVLGRGFDLALHVVDAKSGIAIPNASLHAQFVLRDTGCGIQGPRDVKADSKGTVVLPHCINQPLTITVNAPGYEITDQRFETLRPGQTLDLKLQPGERTEGIVSDKNTGQPIAGATIRIIYQKGPTTGRYEWNDLRWLLATTGDDGRFVANQLRPGTVYWLGISAPGHESIIVETPASGRPEINAQLGPELIVRGEFIGNLDELPEINDHRALDLACPEVVDDNSFVKHEWVYIHDVNGKLRFEFTNRVAGSVTLSPGGIGRDFERQIDAPVDDWVVDLAKTQNTPPPNVPKREVLFRFKDPSGVPPQGTVSIDIPDNLDLKHQTAHNEILQITNGEVRAQIAIGGRTSIEPKYMIGYWFDQFGMNNNLASIQVTNGPGPMIIEVSVIPAGAIYAKALNADGTPAGGLFFGIQELKRAPGRTDSTPLNNEGDSLSDSDTSPRKWVSGPLPLGGTYRVTGWRGNAFCVSKPITLTGENPTAEVELQFTPGKTLEGKVLDSNGRPVPNANLQPSFTLPQDNGFNLNPIFTDADGHFRIENVTAGLGDYFITPFAPRMMAERFKMDFKTQPQTIHLKPGRTIAGQLVEAGTSNVIPGAEIRALNLTTSKLPTVTTHSDANGHFDFNELAAGNYRFYVEGGDPTASLQTYHADTNITLAVKLYPWSKLKPKSPAPESVKNTQDEQIPIAQLVQVGKLMFQIGKMDEAEAKLNQALKRDPENQAAVYYLSLVKQVREKQKIDARNLGNMGHNLPNPNVNARPNIIYTSTARQKVYERLNKITFDKIAFPDLPLSEVVRILTEQTETRDPDGEGVNFVINKVKPAVSTPAIPGQPAFDATTGQPIAPAASTDGIDLGDVRINLDPGLKNLRLMDVLEAIVKTADHPIKYSILDYGIEFSFKGPETPELFTRTFKVDPNTFFMGLQNVGALNFGTSHSGAAGNSSTAIPQVNVAGGTAAGAATARGLRFVSTLDPTTNIQSAVVNLFNALGVSLAPPKTVFFNKRQGTLTVHATTNDLDLIEAAVDTLNTTPPEVTIKARFIQLRHDSTWPKELDWIADAVATNHQSTIAILTDPQFRVVLNALEKRDGADLLNEGQVTTLSGRQAQFQIVNVDTNADVAHGSSSISNSTGSVSTKPDPEQIVSGTTLDTVATVCADGFTIQMTLIPTVVEPVRGDQSGNSAPTIWQVTTNCIVRDGQTVVLGGLASQTANAPSSVNTNLLIFVTTTLIDPAGNRIHSDDYYDSPLNGGDFGRGGGPIHSKDYYDTPIVP